VFIKDRVGGRLHLVPARDDITHLDGKILCLPSADWGIPADPQGGPYPKGVKVHLGFSSFDTKDDKPDLPWDTEDIEELYALQETLLASLQTAPADSTKLKRMPSVDVKAEEIFDWENEYIESQEDLKDEDFVPEPAKKKVKTESVKVKPEPKNNTSEAAPKRLTRSSTLPTAKVPVGTGNTVVAVKTEPNDHAPETAPKRLTRAAARAATKVKVETGN